MQKKLLILLSFLISSHLFAQNKYVVPSFTVKSTLEKIKIDGVLDENTWQQGKTVGDFWQYFPTDTIRAKSQTEIYMAFDDKNLYVAAKCYSVGKNYVIPSYRRDYRAGGNDNISLVFDTFNDKTNAFLFGMNPYGVTREALIANGGSDNDNFNTYWDNKWQGTSKIYDGYWICEMAIPLTTVRFKENSQRWNFMAYRFETQVNETTSLVRIPQNQLIFNLAFTAPMFFEKPLKKPGANISIIPYLTAASSKDFENAKNPTAGSRLGYGADAKIAVTSGLNLDLTYNPDFSTVEADRQVTNLSRFDITYPEQRQFFLENSDLFTNFGNQSINPFLPQSTGQGITPFFSRRIGVALDSTTGVFVPNKILYGIRLNGKLDDNWRIGLMNTQTERDDFKGISGAMFTVAAIQRKVFSRSNIAFIFADKENLNLDVNSNLKKYNRMAGLEYNLATDDNKWAGKFYYHQSFSPNSIASEEFAQGMTMTYNVKKFTVNIIQELVGKDYTADIGYVPRNNYWHINPAIGWQFYTKNRWINRQILGFNYDQTNELGFGVTDRQIGPFWSVTMQNSARLLVNLSQNYTFLDEDFDVLRSNRKLPSLKANTGYTYYNFSANYTSDQRKKWQLIANPTIGEYYDGSIVSLVGAVLYRFQPYGSLTMNMSYNRIDVSAGKNNVYVIGPKLDLTFSKSVFWTTYIQYNSQYDNMNVNSRLQWRFAPVSDMFLVYTDNYNTNTWGPKNRGILIKFTYWFNV